MLENKETVTTPEEVDAEVVEEAEPVESDEAEDSEETTEDSKSEEAIDYKAVIEAEKKAADEAFRKREERRERQRELAQSTEAEDSDDTEDDRPLTRKEFLQMMQQREQDSVKTSQLDQVKRIIAENTSSDDEAEAALLMYQNRVVPTGDAEADALFAIGGLNVNRSKAIAEELKRSVNAKQNVSKSPNQHQPETNETKEPKITSADAQAIKSSGFVWDGKKRIYTKQVGKRTMFFDPKKPQGQKQWIV